MFFFICNSGRQLISISFYNDTRARIFLASVTSLISAQLQENDGVICSLKFCTFSSLWVEL